MLGGTFLIFLCIRILVFILFIFLSFRIFVFILEHCRCITAVAHGSFYCFDKFLGCTFLLFIFILILIFNLCIVLLVFLFDLFF